MARQSQDVVVRFVGDTGNLARGMDGLKGRFVGVASSLDGIAKAGAVVAAASFFKTAIGEAREAERVTRQTEQALRSTGATAGVTSKHIAGLSEKLSELAGVDDEVIQHGANVLLTFTKIRNEVGSGNDVFDQATTLALDMSAALSESGDAGADFQSSVTRIGKALQDPIKGISALSKVGVSFTQQQKDQIATLVESGDTISAQKIILRELQTEYGGMAAATADSVGKAQVSWANFAEDVGKKVMPAVTAVSNWTLSTGIPALGSLASTVGNVLEPAFHGLVSIGRETVEMWQGLPSPVQNAAIAMGAWMIVGDRVEGFFSRTSGPMRTFGEDVRTVMSAGQGEVGRFGASMQVLQDRIPTLGAMGVAFRTAKGDAQGFGSTLHGIAASGFAGVRSAAGGLVNFLGGPWGLAVGGAAAILSIWISRQDAAKQAAAAHEARIKSLTQEIVDNGGAVSKQTKLQQIQAAESKHLFELAGRIGVSQKTMTQAVLGNADAIAEVNRAFDEYNIGSAGFNGNTKKAQEELQGFAGTDGWGTLSGALTLARRDFGGMSGEMLAAQAAAEGSTSKLEAAEAATLELATAQQAGISSTDLYKAAIEGAGIEFDESAGLAEQLRQAIEALTQSEITQMDTLEGYEAAMDALDAAIQENGATLDIHTEKGRANRDALEDLATKSRSLMQADIDAGVPADEALARHDARIAALKQEAIETFGANSEAVGLIDTYGRVPKAVRTAMIVEGYEATHAKMMNLSAGQFLLSEGVPITPANTRAVLNEKKFRFARGGPVSGPGTTTSDSVPALLSQGEFVQRAAAVDYYGPAFMSALNQKRIPREAVPGFAAGGMVWPFKVDVSKTKIPEFASAIGAVGTAGKGVQRWAPLVMRVLAMLGQSPGLLPKVLRRMNQESGGNPRAINLWDSNAKRGTPSIGLMQTIGPTFNAYAGPFRGRGIYDPLANIYAGLNYAIHRYRSLQYAMDKPGGYKNGGWLMPGQIGVNETRKPEAVFNQDQLSSMTRPTVHKTMNVNLNVANRPVDVMQQLRRAEMIAGF